MNFPVAQSPWWQTEILQLIFWWQLLCLLPFYHLILLFRKSYFSLLIFLLFSHGCSCGHPVQVDGGTSAKQGDHSPSGSTWETSFQIKASKCPGTGDVFDVFLSPSNSFRLFSPGISAGLANHAEPQQKDPGDNPGTFLPRRQFGFSLHHVTSKFRHLKSAAGMYVSYFIQNKCRNISVFWYLFP